MPQSIKEETESDKQKEKLKSIQSLLDFQTKNLSPYQQGVQKALKQSGEEHTLQAIQSDVPTSHIEEQSGLKPEQILTAVMAAYSNNNTAQPPQTPAGDIRPISVTGQPTSNITPAASTQTQPNQQEESINMLANLLKSSMPKKGMFERSDDYEKRIGERTGSLEKLARASYLLNGGGNQQTPGFATLLPEQQIQAYDLARKIGGVRGAKNILPSIVSQLTAGIPIDQVEDKLRYSGQSSSMSDEWRGAAQSILTGKTPAQTQKQMDALDDYIQKGDVEGGKSYLKRMALEQAPVDQKIAITGKERTVGLLKEIKDDLSKLEKNGINTNIFSGTYEDINRRLGEVKNPAMRKVATKIATALMNYRRSITGAAFTMQESPEYSKIFPSINNVAELNTANIEGLTEVLNGDTNKFYEQTMGPSNYNKLFGGSSGSSSQPASTGKTITLPSGKTISLGQ